MSEKQYSFGEKKQEYSVKQGTNIDVWLSPKYLSSKKKVIEMLNKYDFLEESDFWILMNETKSNKMAYSGLIISHNGCLKINDNLEQKDKFKAESVKEDKEGFGNSLTFTYINKEQGIYEIGEVSAKNCKNEYPYAMAFKRLFDRVVLKVSKLAFYGVYSDSEADEFKEKNEDSDPKINENKGVTPTQIEKLCKLLKEDEIPMMLNYYRVGSLEDLTYIQAQQTIDKRSK
jgi:hypothetical protein